MEAHVEGFYTPSAQAENIRFDYSEDGGATWTPFTSTLAGFIPQTDRNYDIPAAIPVASGSVMVRAIDMNRTTSSSGLDKISIDQLWLRTAP